MIPFNLIGLLFVLSIPLGLASGLANSRFSYLPALAVGAMIAVWLMALAYLLGWAAECWHCAYDLGNGRYVERSIVPLATAIVGAAAVGLTVGSAWFGAHLDYRRNTP